MQKLLLDEINESSWIDLLLECIEFGISPTDIREFMSTYNTLENQN